MYIVTPSHLHKYTQYCIMFTPLQSLWDLILRMTKDMGQEVYFLLVLLKITKSLYYRSKNSSLGFCLLIFS